LLHTADRGSQIAQPLCSLIYLMGAKVTVDPREHEILVEYVDQYLSFEPRPAAGAR
jgi:hypothetical protein